MDEGEDGDWQARAEDADEVRVDDGEDEAAAAQAAAELGARVNVEFVDSH